MKERKTLFRITSLLLSKKTPVSEAVCAITISMWFCCSSPWKSKPRHLCTGSSVSHCCCTAECRRWHTSLSPETWLLVLWYLWSSVLGTTPPEATGSCHYTVEETVQRERSGLTCRLVCAHIYALLCYLIQNSHIFKGFQGCVCVYVLLAGHSDPVLQEQRHSVSSSKCSL